MWSSTAVCSVSAKGWKGDWLWQRAEPRPAKVLFVVGLGGAFFGGQGGVPLAEQGECHAYVRAWQDAEDWRRR